MKKKLVWIVTTIFLLSTLLSCASPSTRFKYTYKQPVIKAPVLSKTDLWPYQIRRIRILTGSAISIPLMIRRRNKIIKELEYLYLKRKELSVKRDNDLEIEKIDNERNKLQIKLFISGINQKKRKINSLSKKLDKLVMSKNKLIIKGKQNHRVKKVDKKIVKTNKEILRLKELVEILR